MSFLPPRPDNLLTLRGKEEDGMRKKQIRRKTNKGESTYLDPAKANLLLEAQLLLGRGKGNNEVGRRNAAAPPQCRFLLLLLLRLLVLLLPLFRIRARRLGRDLLHRLLLADAALTEQGGPARSAGKVVRGTVVFALRGGGR